MRRRCRIKFFGLFLLLSFCCFCLLMNGRQKRDNSLRKLHKKSSDEEQYLNSVVHSRKIASLPASFAKDGDDAISQFIAVEKEESNQSKAKHLMGGEDLKTKDIKDDFARAVTLDDIFISVKTTGKFHRTRLQVILDTWFTKAPDQTYFFTDEDDPEYNEKSGGHLINSQCNGSHTRHDLSCKMGKEYERFLQSRRKWWCHFDDDNYVNTDRLLDMLLSYDWRDDMYIGRASLNHPFHSTYHGSKVAFWFATGGAGVCISLALGKKMEPWCGNNKLVETSDELKVPDDCTLGFVANNRLGVELTQSNLLHSHLESLQDIRQSTLKDQVSLSYRVGETSSNLVAVDTSLNGFDKKSDPTMFLSLHCMLHPTARVCKNKARTDT